MRKLIFLVVLSCVLNVSNSYAVTHTCKCTVNQLHAGFIGGTGNSSKSKIECGNGVSYYIGTFDNELVRVRHSMALAAQMANKQVVLQYYSSDGAKSCDVASSNSTVFPDGMYIE
ncbi:hypothetical protein [Agaribacterium sp. ZY112]|uniref:hypothetical protein n=1 Tax=Agaribacterium sp. ZY112 TaxID=3233574 RepID=UPI0035264DF6